MRITSRVINHLTTTVSFAPFHTSFRKQLILGHSSGVSCKLVIIIDGQILTDSRLSPSLLVKLQFTLPYFLCAPSIDRCRCVDFDYPARPFDFFFLFAFSSSPSHPLTDFVLSLYISALLSLSQPCFRCSPAIVISAPTLIRPVSPDKAPYSTHTYHTLLQTTFPISNALLRPFICVFHLATIFISWCHLWYL